MNLVLMAIGTNDSIAGIGTPVTKQTLKNLLGLCATGSKNKEIPRICVPGIHEDCRNEKMIPIFRFGEQWHLRNIRQE